MIIVTGGAGFIGSNLVGALKKRGERVVVVDRLRASGKWRNLSCHPPDALIEPDQFKRFLQRADGVKALFHLGAISSTTATDGDEVWRTNVALSDRLFRWCAKAQVPYIYASSAATYGAADRPEAFSDDPKLFNTLKPLNLYGWSKHVADLHAYAVEREGLAVPPQWVGLKFFNVYGPNEYHKGKMISVVKVKFDEVMSGRVPTLFRSDRNDIADGQQKRDFIWVGDVIKILLWVLDNPKVNGIYNCGTGVARSYLDLAYAVCAACGVARDVAFIDMPSSLHGQYQSYTQADMSRFRSLGYRADFTSLEEGVARYVKTFLQSSDPYVR